MKKSNSLSQKIIKIREKAGLNQTEFSKLLDIPQSSISSFENGTSIPHYNTLKKLINISKKYDIKFLLEDMLNAEELVKENKKTRKKT